MAIVAANITNQQGSQQKTIEIKPKTAQRWETYIPRKFQKIASVTVLKLIQD